MVITRVHRHAALLVTMFVFACGDGGGGEGGEGGTGGTAGTGGGAGTGGTAGSGGGSGNGFGTITIAGPDAAEVGTSYSPPLVTAFVDEFTGAVSWAGPPGRGVTLGFLPDGTPQTAALIFATADESYSYFLTCALDPPACGTIAVDVDGQSVTFDEVTLPVAPGDIPPPNVATAPIVIDGTLTWE
ncbi:MAG: hypothetical protein AAGF92_15475 [Myxococcota bacterium]